MTDPGLHQFLEAEIKAAGERGNNLASHLTAALVHRFFNGCDPLPCDVRLPPRTVIRKGCALETLLTGLRARS